MRVYARLLALYPPSFLERHREEMLQNFADLEDTAGPKAKLWLWMGKDLVMSLASQFFRSRLGMYVIAVLVGWMLLFVVGYLVHGPTRGHPALHAFAGFLPGLLAVYVAARLFGPPPNDMAHFFKSRFDLYVIAVFVGSAMLFVIGHHFYAPTRGAPGLQVFGGSLIGMLAMYIAIHFYGMP